MCRRALGDSEDEKRRDRSAMKGPVPDFGTAVGELGICDAECRQRSPWIGMNRRRFRLALTFATCTDAVCSLEAAIVAAELQPPAVDGVVRASELIHQAGIGIDLPMQPLAQLLRGFRGLAQRLLLGQFPGCLVGRRKIVSLIAARITRVMSSLAVLTDMEGAFGLKRMRLTYNR